MIHWDWIVTLLVGVAIKELCSILLSFLTPSISRKIIAFNSAAIRTVSPEAGHMYDSILRKVGVDLNESVTDVDSQCLHCCQGVPHSQHYYGE